jgi:hypothetical protein
MTPVDPYSMTNKLDDALIKVVVTRLHRSPSGTPI